MSIFLFFLYHQVKSFLFSLRWGGKCFIVLLSFSFLYPSLAMAQGESEDNLEALDALQQDTFMLKHSDLVTIEKNELEDISEVYLRGSVHIVFKNINIFADEITAYLKDGEVNYFRAAHHVIVQRDKELFLAAYLYAYGKDNFVKAINLVGKESRLFFHLGDLHLYEGLEELNLVNFTTSKRLYPHYVLHTTQIFREKSVGNFIYGMNLKIGQDPILYIPFIYTTQMNSQISLALAYGNLEGFIVNSTFQQKDETSFYELALDYYENVGFYLGNHMEFELPGSLVIHTAMAYTPNLRYYNYQLEQYFPIGSGEYVVGYSMRYNLYLTYYGKILQSNASNPLDLSLRTNFKQVSDPYFISQFESNRLFQTNINSFLFPSDNTAYTSLGSGRDQSNAREINWKIDGSLWGTSFMVEQVFIYGLTRNEDNENPYSVGYYDFIPQSFTNPSVSISKTFNYYTLDLGEEAIKWSFPINHYVGYVFNQKQTFSRGSLIQEISNHTVTMNFDFPNTLTLGGWSIKDPFSIDNKDTIQFIDTNSLPTKAYIKNVFNSNIDYGPDFTYTFQNPDFSFYNDIDLRWGYTQNYQKTDFASEDEQVVDDLNRFQQTRAYTGIRTGVSYNPEQEYFAWELFGEWGKEAFREKKKAEGELLNDRDTVFYGGGASFLKTDLTLYSSGVNFIYEEEDTFDTRFLDFSVSSNLIPYVEIQNQLSYNQIEKKKDRNLLTFNLETENPVIWGDSLIFYEISLSLAWEKNFLYPVNDYLSYRWAFSFRFSRWWSVEWFLEGANRYLYIYNTEEYPSNFWEDLWNSLQIWSSESLLHTYFQLENFGLQLNHDLEEWDMNLLASLSPSQNSYGQVYIDFQISFNVNIKDLWGSSSQSEGTGAASSLDFLPGITYERGENTR